jgi:hypothetical protein
VLAQRGMCVVSKGYVMDHRGVCGGTNGIFLLNGGGGSLKWVLRKGVIQYCTVYFIGLMGDVFPNK